MPALLRRVADSSEGLGDVEVHDITYSLDVDAEGSRPSMTVYYERQ